MKKRTVAALLTAFLILPALITAGSVFVVPKMPFDSFDAQWALALEEAISEKAKNNTEASKLPEEERFIVKFSSDIALEDIYTALSKEDYTLLAQSENRLFAIYNRDFIEANSHLIEYYEEDNIRNTFAVVNDPATMPAYESLGINAAWDKATGDSDIIVAVLDTGISRSHEDLKDANILAGYDAVSRKAGVYDDSAGHGTSVSGIIAATANNNLGIAGVAYGVTILPVKVSTSGTTIYSSDLVRGIRFAADAGAKIINMSIGGYSYSFAEQEAINYAVSKGCIVISAAGNGGNSDFADQKSYPASYDNVISVASCNADGERSIFSQYNDSVDVAAIGENITMPVVDSDGYSVYKTDSGTSYACAFVSGIAALTASYLDEDIRFENSEFLALIADTCGNERDDYLGYGIINADSIIAMSELPIVTGVTDGESYSESVTIGFNRGTADLGGETIEDGETIVASGNHTLTVTDGKKQKVLKFRLDYTPLSYEYREFASYSYFEFDRGNATLDGFPYNSGDKITVSGRHEFTLTEGDEKLTKTINLRHSLPAVYGVEDGQTYRNPIEILVVGNGSATLDGNEVYGEIAVAESGNHSLVVKSANGAVSKEYKFAIDFKQGEILQIDYANGKAAIDEENGYICLYGDTLVGARIYDISAPEEYLHFLPIGKVYGHAFRDDKLLLFGDSGVTVLDRQTVLEGQESVITAYTTEEISYYTYAEGYVFGFGNGNMYMLDTETGEHSLIAELGYECEQAFYTDGYLYIANPSQDGIIHIFDMISGQSTEYDLGVDAIGASLCFGGSYISAGNRLYNAINGRLVMEFQGGHAVKIESNTIYTEGGIIEISTGRITARFPFEVSDIVYGTESNYIFGVTPECALVNRNAEGVYAVAAAVCNDKMFAAPEDTSIYRTNLYHSKYYQPISAAASQNILYTVFKDKYAVYRINTADKTELSPIWLCYEPSKTVCGAGYMAVLFDNANAVYITNEAMAESGKYIQIPGNCSDAAIANGSIYAIIGEHIVVIDILSGEIITTEIAAQDITADESNIFIRNGSILTVCDFELNSKLELAVIPNGELQAGNGIAVSRTVYDISTGETIARTDSKIIAYRSNTLVTEEGVFDVKAQEYIGNTGIYSPKFVAIGGNNSVVAIGGGIVAINYCAEGDEVVTDPDIRGIEPYEVLTGSAVISYAHGVGYLDGNPFKSGNSADEAGTHIFSLSLPCGRNISIQFTILAPLSGIEFLAGNRTMSVGETIALSVVYLPEGASSIPVSFKCDSDGISVSESGEVTALKVGEYEVIATAVTENGSYKASSIITVRDDIIAVAPESNIIIDRNNNLMKGIPVGTKTSDLLNILTTGKTAKVLNSKGDSAKGYIATGHRIVLLDNSGKISDELHAVVTGDTDGDGCISAYDMYELSRILKGYEYSTAFTVAADINGNGVVADNDYRALKKIILGRTEADTGKPADSLFGSCTVQTVSYIESNDIIDVAICISGSKYARGIFGSLNYSEGLEFQECLSTDWETDCYDHGDKISFYAYDESGLACQSAFKAILNLRFKVIADQSKKLSFTAENFTVSFENGCRNVRFQNAELKVSPRVYDDFNIIFANSNDFAFDPSVHEYEVTIPHNNALADIRITHNINEEATVSSLLIPEEGEETVVVTYTNEEGATEFYNIVVSRDSAPEIDSNCRLETLEVEGHRLSPVFDADFFEYSIEVPYGTEKINVYCLPQNSTATVIVGDTKLTGENTPITITVGALDGETLTYTINVKMQPKPEESSTEPIPVDLPEETHFPLWAIITIPILLLAIAAVAIKMKRK